MRIAPGSTSLGFIGLGVMGRSMAQHLLEAGFELHVSNRTKAKADELCAAGATWHDSPAELAPHCDVLITIVGYPEDVEAVWLGDDGLLAQARPGSYGIDMTTSSPQLAERIAAVGAERDVHCLDAPVSGGDVGAREARLAIMVGGERAAFDALAPIWQTLGTNIVYQGPAGSGQHCKMANQIAIASTMLGVCEALAYARAAGLDAETVRQTIAGGAAGSWTLDHLAPRMLAGDDDPGFFVKHFIKDMDIAAASSAELGGELPGLALALHRYRELAERAGEELGTQALFRLYDATASDGAG